MEPDDLLCSRNARPEKALVGRAQWKINQPPSLEEITIELGRSMRGRARQSSVLVQRAVSEEDGEVAGRVSVLAEPPR
jgi:hypothetical protein